MDLAEGFGTGMAIGRSFGVEVSAKERSGGTRDRLAMMVDKSYQEDNGFEDEENEDDDLSIEEGAEEGEGDEEEQVGDSNVQIAELNWRVAKLKLEEAHTRSFLKSKPRYLPYEECRKWVAAWNRWSSEEEWKEWIDMGEKRNAYIPARPDEYYGRLGKWISWNHFLGVDTGQDGESSSSSDESIGAFD